MGRRDAAHSRRGGGEGIPASRSARAQVGAAGGAVALAAGLGAWLALEPGEAAGTANAALAGLAVLVLAAGLVFRRPAAAVPTAVVLLGGAYVVLLSVEDVPLDMRAAAVAAALLAIAELAYWSLEVRAAVTDEPGSYARRLAVLALLALGALALSGGLLALVDVAGRGGLAAEIVGAGAALGALLLLLGLVRRT